MFYRLCVGLLQLGKEYLTVEIVPIVPLETFTLTHIITPIGDIKPNKVPMQYRLIPTSHITRLRLDFSLLHGFASNLVDRAGLMSSGQDRINEP